MVKQIISLKDVIKASRDVFISREKTGREKRAI